MRLQRTQEIHYFVYLEGTGVVLSRKERCPDLPAGGLPGPVQAPWLLQQQNQRQLLHN